MNALLFIASAIEFKYHIYGFFTYSKAFNSQKSEKHNFSF